MHTSTPDSGIHADGSSIPRSDRGTLHIEGDRWRFVGLEIVNGQYGIFSADTSNGRHERLITRDNYESGLHLQGASWNNQIINLDSYGNHDPRKNGESADGLANRESSGTGNVVRGTRLWRNADDGFDNWLFLRPILIEDSIAYDNGYNYWNLPDYASDGDGFKLGGGDDLRRPSTTSSATAWPGTTPLAASSTTATPARWSSTTATPGQRQGRVQRLPVSLDADEHPRGCQHHQRVSGLVGRLRQLVEPRQHLESDQQHRPVGDHRTTGCGRHDPHLDVPAAGQQGGRGRTDLAPALPST
ncbi:right-handed parallel beta-helix repeat-containing protein [Dactylosporangium sp. NPDC000555]|uniref:right-handed parallel beta-helix repeat-containing protein n=1 Tax=Dactylosporangium sp. NPDC000555 TaxID=3154260 RepID=UPI003318C50B